MSRQPSTDLLKEVVSAWESLAGGQQSVRAIERWLAEDMKPVIDKVRAALARGSHP